MLFVDEDVIGKVYVEVLYYEVYCFLDIVEDDELFGVCFLGGIDFGVVFVFFECVLCECGQVFMCFKVFILNVGGGVDVVQV